MKPWAAVLEADWFLGSSSSRDDLQPRERPDPTSAQAYDLGVRDVAREPRRTSRHHDRRGAGKDRALALVARCAGEDDRPARGGGEGDREHDPPFGPQVDPATVHRQAARSRQKSAQPVPRRLAPAATAPAAARHPAMDCSIISLLKDAEAALNTDRKLAESYAKAGNVVQPMLFVLGEPLGSRTSRAAVRAEEHDRDAEGRRRLVQVPDVLDCACHSTDQARGH